MSRVAEYYVSAELYEPPRIEYREFGFIKKGRFIRHKVFWHVSDLRKYLILEEPDEVFYSSAYYQHPSLIPMTKKRKCWVGCDLVFDFDMTDTLSGTKEEARYFSLKVLRFFQRQGAREILYVESGKKGYHVHIQDWEILKFTAGERSRVVDFFRRKTEHGNPNYAVFDEDITRDITRMIRLPGSLYIRDKFNGKCVQLQVPGSSWEIEFNPRVVFSL